MTNWKTIESAPRDGEPDMFDMLKRLNGWLGDVAECDPSEIVADGGVTSGMVIVQEAREQQRRVRAMIAEVCECRLGNPPPPSETE